MGKKFKNGPLLLRTNPVACVAFLLFAGLVLGMTYGPANKDEALGWLVKYRELLLVVVLIPFLAEERARAWAMYAFFAGVFVSLLISFGMGLGVLPFKQAWGPSILSRITHSAFVAYFAFWAAHRFFSDDNKKWLWLLALILGVYNIFFMIASRTGYVIFVLLALLFIYQRFSWRYRLIGVGLLVAMLAVFLSLSGKFSGRISETGAGYQEYGANAEQYTDGLGYRLEFMENAWNLIRQKPILGYGTGSFPKVYASVARLTGRVPTDNPHNEYMLLAIQLGLPGVMLFVGLFGVMWRYARMLPEHDTWLAQGLVVTMGSGCFVNSWLLDAHEGHFFAYFTAVFFASLVVRPGKNRSPA
ncbi:MAG: hypothetical protein A2521_03495 [Deltaproteobacteria bacterium RIFOXYD12_FULL_57_12]|nr:MAG: hypothetical protein A2521_03495 [Deltaproteobacteria bacterium RIFOXYD12_FULL_57_12]